MKQKKIDIDSEIDLQAIFDLGILLENLSVRSDLSSDAMDLLNSICGYCEVQRDDCHCPRERVENTIGTISMTDKFNIAGSSNYMRLVTLLFILKIISEENFHKAMDTIEVRMEANLYM